MPKNKEKSRSRSRSPHSTRKSDKYLTKYDNKRERMRDRERDQRKNRRRSRSPRSRRRSRSPRRSDSKDNKEMKSTIGGAVPQYLLNRPEISEKELEGKTDEELEMIKIMGFTGFDSTKGKHVVGNDLGAVHLLQKRKYRQYMNRKGGFNRPLDQIQ